MAHHKSAKKRIRQDAKKSDCKIGTTKSPLVLLLRKLRDMTDKQEAETFMPKVASMIDKLAKREILGLKNRAVKFEE